MCLPYPPLSLSIGVQYSVREHREADDDGSVLLTRTGLCCDTNCARLQHVSGEIEFSWMLLCQKNNLFCSAACNGLHHFVLMQSGNLETW